MASWVLNRHIWLPYWTGRSENISIVAECAVGQHSLRNQVSGSSLPNVQADSLLSLESLSVWGLMSATLDCAWPGSAPQPLTKSGVQSRAIIPAPLLQYKVATARWKATVTNMSVWIWPQGHWSCMETQKGHVWTLFHARLHEAIRHLPRFWKYWHTACTFHDWNRPFRN